MTEVTINIETFCVVVTLAFVFLQVIDNIAWNVSLRHRLGRLERKVEQLSREEEKKK